jgi:hypothetical protein
LTHQTHQHSQNSFLFCEFLVGAVHLEVSKLHDQTHFCSEITLISLCFSSSSVVIIIIIIIPRNPPPCSHPLCDNPAPSSVMASHDASPAACLKRHCVCDWGAECKNSKKLLHQAGNVLLTRMIPIKRGSNGSNDTSVALRSVVTSPF